MYREIGRATFPAHRRGVDILGILSIVMLVGVTFSGIWQFFAHTPDPDWFAYVPDTGFTVAEKPPSGMRMVHDLFATGSGVLALAGSGWFAYRIAHGFPMLAVVAIVVSFFGALVGPTIQFTLLKLEGQSFDEVGPGYLQMFTGNLEYAVTDIHQIGPGTFQLLVLSHILTIPILVGFAWWSIRRAIDRRTAEIANAPNRSWILDMER
jgi:hypothetical protein